MGFSLGSSFVSQSPPIQSLSPPHFSFLHRHRMIVKKRMVTPMASLQSESSSGSSSSSGKRVFLILSISALPFFQLKARAVEGLVQDKQITMVASAPDIESPPQAASNPFVALLNGIGIIGLGILGALYALAWREKRDLESTIESMKTKLTEKEAEKSLLEKNFKKKLANEQEERSKQSDKAKEEMVSLSKKLSFAGNEFVRLQRELHTEKKSVQDLEVKVDQLQDNLSQAVEDKKILENKLHEREDTVESLQERISLLNLEIKDKETDMKSLRSSLAEKESGCMNLTSILDQTKAELAEANNKIKELTDEVLKIRGQLEVKQSLVGDLNEQIHSLIAERDGVNLKNLSLQEAYDTLKLSSAEKADSDLKILTKRDQELSQLQEKLDFVSNEANSRHALILELEKERDGLKALLEKEMVNVKNLEGELHITKAILGESRVEVSELLKQLSESKKSCEVLSSEISRTHSEFASTEKSLLKSLDEANSSSKQLSDELTLAMDVVMETKEELLASTEKLKVETETCEKLQKEVAEIHKKAENAAQELLEERNMVTSMRKELDALEKQIVEEKEARQTIGIDLEEATKSLGDMKRKAIFLSEELDIVNSRASNLEDEKNYLYASLTDQKEVTKVARENLEDAQNLISRLGKERESTEKKAKRLEEELASAKGEILRLRRQMNATVNSVNEPTEQKDEDVDESGVVVKRSPRRRKATPSKK
ncbi:MAR-binding filament-like protein 1-1 [Aristolochia californica]|uniref:MAR-binding filament-like protein 1-1 n=1 Tax=Aristolochia californica TaxID=171875 RepID=UPI0035E10578